MIVQSSRSWKDITSGDVRDEPTHWVKVLYTVSLLGAVTSFWPRVLFPPMHSVDLWNIFWKVEYCCVLLTLALNWPLEVRPLKAA